MINYELFRNFANGIEKENEKSQADIIQNLSHPRAEIRGGDGYWRCPHWFCR